MRKTIFALIGTCLFLVGCTDAQLASVSAYGANAKVECYSGGDIVFSDTSTGKVVSLKDGDGLAFKSTKTGKYIRVYADCIVSEL